MKTPRPGQVDPLKQFIVDIISRSTSKIRPRALEKAVISSFRITRKELTRQIRERERKPSINPPDLCFGQNFDVGMPVHFFGN